MAWPELPSPIADHRLQVFKCMSIGQVCVTEYLVGVCAIFPKEDNSQCFPCSKSPNLIYSTFPTTLVLHHHWLKLKTFPIEAN